MKHNFSNLEVWKKSMDLANDIYNLTNSFPNAEKFGLTSQIRRSAVSIPSNIAEGCGRNTNAQLKYFINVATGSACELETQICISFRQNLLSIDQKNSLLNDTVKIRKMLFRFKEQLS